MRFIKHVLFLSAIVVLIAVVPNYSSAKVEYLKPVNQSDVDLAVNKSSPELPIKILIPSHDINLDVEYSKIENETWEVPELNAGFAEGSSYINETHGNSIIFAHARDGLFRNLKGINLNDKIILIGEENLYEYEVDEIIKILPEEIDFVKSSGKHHLTLFTCEGFSDEYRLLVKAKRVSKLEFDKPREVI